MAQSFKNIALPAIALGFVGSASYLAYKGLKGAFDWGNDIVTELWDATILSSKNREEWSEYVSQPENNPYSGEGPTQKQILTRTFHFWTGGIFQ